MSMLFHGTRLSRTGFELFAEFNSGSYFGFDSVEMAKCPKVNFFLFNAGIDFDVFKF